MLACSWLSYVDRQILAVLSPTILAETGMSTESYTEVVRAFSIAYMLSNFMWGSALDFVGLRVGMLVAVGLWTFASASHAFLGGFLGFVIARTLLGLGEGATFPGGFRASLDSLPPDKQSRGIALSYSGGSLGAIVTPLIVVPISLAYGWRMAFLFTGAMGVVWLLLWWATARPPFLHPPARRPERIVLPNFLERRFWALVAAYAVCAFALGPILYLAPLYLSRAMNASQQVLGEILWIPPLGWEVGYFFWGWASDRYGAAKRPLRAYILFTVLSLPLAAVTFTSSVTLVMLLFFWAMFIASGFIVVSLRSGASMYPPGQSSMVAGIAAGSWSALVAIILPELGDWFDQKLYTQTFVVVSLMPVLGTFAWWLLTRGRGMLYRQGEA